MFDASRIMNGLLKDIQRHYEPEKYLREERSKKLKKLKWRSKVNNFKKLIRI